MSELLEISDHIEHSYKPVVDFGAWRVAYYNNTTDEVTPVDYLERHLETDEVFVLVAGSCQMIVSPTGSEAFEVTEMEPLKIYNVKSAAYHQVALQPGCRLLIVENVDTCEKNSLYCHLTPEQKQHVCALLREGKKTQ